MSFDAAVATAIDAAEGGRFVPRTSTAVAGGCIDGGRLLTDGRRRYFVKSARGAAARFAAEADGLAALAACDALVVPRVVARGHAGDGDFRVREWLDLSPRGDQARLGEALAALHANTFDVHGWPRDNFIGATAQANAPAADWADFFLTRRLAPQLALAADHGAADLQRAAQWLFAAPPTWLMHRPAPSLLHGDLWRGNVGFVAGRPALFDPAVYAGDAETDLAMAELFGGFSAAFFAAHAALRAPAEGSMPRRRLYQLYHVLNHFNLFGGGYAAQAAALLAAVARRR